MNMSVIWWMNVFFFTFHTAHRSAFTESDVSRRNLSEPAGIKTSSSAEHKYWQERSRDRGWWVTAIIHSITQTHAYTCTQTSAHTHTHINTRMCVHAHKDNINFITDKHIHTHTLPNKINTFPLHLAEALILKFSEMAIEPLNLQLVDYLLYPLIHSNLQSVICSQTWVYTQSHMRKQAIIVINIVICKKIFINTQNHAQNLHTHHAHTQDYSCQSWIWACLAERLWIFYRSPPQIVMNLSWGYISLCVSL